MASPEMVFDLTKAPYFFGSQENWAQTNTGPKKLAPREIWFLKKNDFHAVTKFFGTK